ncbi:MAG: hypothetical protein SOR95_00855 [Sutterella sp.]|nr:hypothetical protein [Sutterella sp.]
MPSLAHANPQDSVPFSRVVNSGEAKTQRHHPPSIETYFNQVKPHSDIKVLPDKFDSLGMSQYSVITDTDPMGHWGGSMPNVVGIRYQFAPEMEERYGGTASNGKKWSELTDEEITQEIGQKGDELSDISDKIGQEVEEVSTSHLFWYDSAFFLATTMRTS